MRQYDWNDLKLFLQFTRSGTTRGAGEALGISHSTIARRLDALSTLAGGPLYLRAGGNLQLTGTGREVLNAARTIEDELVILERRAFGQSRELSGRVTLSTGDVLSGPALLAILKQFTERFPKIDLRLITSFSLSDLDRGEADLALRFGERPSDHLVGRRLTQTGRAVYASPSYVRDYLKDGETIGAGWISFSPEGSREGWKKSTPFPDLPTNMRIFDMRTQQVACRAGVGLVMLPCLLCDPDPELVRISEPEFVPRQDLWLLRHTELRENARVRALSDHIVKALPDMLPLLKGETRETVDLGHAKP